MRDPTTPRWAAVLLRRLAPPDRADDLIGDIEESHRRRVERGGRAIAAISTCIETLDLAFVLFRARVREWRMGTFRRSQKERPDPNRHFAPTSSPVFDLVKKKDLTPSALDFKLGLRMLRRYPGLTTVGTLAIAAAVALGTAYFEVVGKVLRPTIPLEDGDRIVQLENWDAAAFEWRPVSLQEVTLWREQLELFLAVVAIMAVAGVSACGAPVRRALRVQPTEALRET